ncbi:uncharacterized protein LOC141831756 [Curcuma longa]|uniref:uncharacterized protein LOC141831756 n=1 Tax=Curcuma longa TaxID=136217 RepID=UPI003D9F9276
MVANESQAENVLYGNDGSVSVLPAGATIILSSTVSPGFLMDLEKRIRAENKGLNLVDAPVSGGVKRAADGTLTIMASGTDEALLCAGSILSVLSEKLYVIKGGCGAASSVKMVNQLLAGVHIAAAAEAMAFSARLGLKTRELFELIKHTGGFSCWNKIDTICGNTELDAVMVNTRCITDNRDPVEERNHEETVTLTREDLNQHIHRDVQEALRHAQPLPPPIHVANVPLGGQRKSPLDEILPPMGSTNRGMGPTEEDSHESRIEEGLQDECRGKAPVHHLDDVPETPFAQKILEQELPAHFQ